MPIQILLSMVRRVHRRPSELHVSGSIIFEVRERYEINGIQGVTIH